MTRARTMSYVLWSVLAVGCGGDDKDRVGSLPDAPAAPDAAPDAATDAAPDAAAGPAFSVSELPLIATTCGDAAPAAVELTIRNTGGQSLVISTAEITGGFVLVTELPLTIAGGASATVSVRPPLAVIGTDRGGSTKSGTLSVTTNEPGTPTHEIALTATVQGANLDFVNVDGDPVSLSFSSGTACQPQAVFLRNSGNQPVGLSAPTALGGSPESLSLGFSGFSGGTLEAGATVRQDVRVITSGACSGFDSASYGITSGDVCTTDTTIQATIRLGFGNECSCD